MSERLEIRSHNGCEELMRWNLIYLMLCMIVHPFPRAFYTKPIIHVIGYKPPLQPSQVK